MEFHMRLACQGKATGVFAAVEELTRPRGFRVVAWRPDRLELTRVVEASSPLDWCASLTFQRRPGGVDMKGRVDLDDRAALHLLWGGLAGVVLALFPMINLGLVVGRERPLRELSWPLIIPMILTGLFFAVRGYRACRESQLSSPAFMALRQLGRAIEAEARRGPPPKLRLTASLSAQRCAYCHGGLVAGEGARCGGCGTCLHTECWAEAGACPTLGCVTMNTGGSSR